jgi:hypothetical protein
MGPRPTYEDENGFYSATSLPGSAALSFVISTGAERSLCGCLFLEMFFDGAKPRDLQFSSSASAANESETADPSPSLVMTKRGGR